MKAWPDDARQKMRDLADDEHAWMTRIRRRGYLIDHLGHPIKVPEDLLDIYQERWPDLGADKAEA